MKRIPGVKAAFLGTRIVALSDADVRSFLRPKKQGKLKRAADRAWEELAKKKGK